MGTLGDWFVESRLRWELNVGRLTQERVTRQGYWVVGLDIPVDGFCAFHRLRNSLANEATQSPFDYLEEPLQQDTCFVRPNVINTRRWWCANRDVKTFCLQQYGDDWQGRVYGMTMLRRIAEIVDHAQRLTRRINPHADTFGLRLEWCGLANRQLLLHSDDPVGVPGTEDAEPIDVAVPQSVPADKPQLLLHLSEPLFRAFRYRADLASVEDWLAQRSATAWASTT
jgi:hypothetical protein